MASWYGKKFHGRKTSSGEIYNMHAMTAAHKTLPLGTRLRVKNLGNHKEIEVRVNDRGPFVRGRIIDLSYEAARRLEIVGPGTGEVEIVALGVAAAASAGGGTGSKVDYYQGNFTIQVGAFENPANAQRLKDELAQKYQNVHITTVLQGAKTLYRVRVGRCRNLEKALEYESYLTQQGFAAAMVVAED